MPEATLRVSWPDGTDASYYSPSSIIGTHFRAGEVLPPAGFVARAASALAEASRRVERLYGSPCSRAASSLRRIEADAAEHGRADGNVSILAVTVAGADR